MRKGLVWTGAAVAAALIAGGAGFTGAALARDSTPTAPEAMASSAPSYSAMPSAQAIDASHAMTACGDEMKRRVGDGYHSDRVDGASWLVRTDGPWQKVLWSATVHFAMSNTDSTVNYTCEVAGTNDAPTFGQLTVG